ncbi:MAG: hypothetical protein GY856_18180 [bacterium]|nr:hypothetical protein [bacterium]
MRSRYRAIRRAKLTRTQGKGPGSQRPRRAAAAWVRGAATPLLPGEPVHTLVLVPAGG